MTQRQFVHPDALEDNVATYHTINGRRTEKKRTNGEE
jgi:hypothetical protein